ncbi:endomucin-like isoform X2 [Hyperolius riggenbachi]|uniref:endomucin-like isoform X2 n=1 Tax=Hyperolius riggenbachi TaxID=752182 RepID=UPI0035A3400C
MSHGIMKPIGATALILTVINLLAVSSRTESNQEGLPDPSSNANKAEPEPEPIKPSVSSSNESNPGTSPDPSSNANKAEPAPQPTKPSVSSSNESNPGTSPDPSSKANKAEPAPEPTKPSVAEKAVSSTSPPNVTSSGSTDSQTHATPDSSMKFGNNSAVNSSTIASTTSGASGNDTLPSPGIRSSTEPTDAKHGDKITTERDNVVPSSAAPPPEKTTTGLKGFTARPDKNQIDGPNKETPKSQKGVIVPVVVCVVAGIAVVLLVVLYKMCQKKPAVPERMEEVKPTDQTKENVKLLSVKTSPPTSDAKRTPASQMESIEC